MCGGAYRGWHTQSVQACLEDCAVWGRDGLNAQRRETCRAAASAARRVSAKQRSGVLVHVCNCDLEHFIAGAEYREMGTQVGDRDV